MVRDYYRGELGAASELVIAPDTGFKVALAYDVAALGATVVITPDGESAGWAAGPATKDELSAQIEAAGT